ncbi:MAG: gliding motility-associated ABC transporter ATP-binding subunit GldA [Capnocytophaga sp.]|nr:gliding motility-associated ABC transporter ATP-binding subunit GldA [Capnocytophaga sp.]
MSVVVEKLVKKYHHQEVIKGISFTLKKGEITGFLGPNGAGKTTTMKMLTGATNPDSGHISINGLSLENQLIEAQKHIGYLPEHNPLYLEMYVREYLQFVADIYNVKKKEIATVIEKTNLTSHANKRIEELSKGYRQRVGLAAAILHNPDILILDEPTTGLDPNQILEIRQIIKELGKEKIILLSSHIMQEIQAMCDRVIILHQGEIILDKKMKELQDKEQTIEVLFDYRVEHQLLKRIPNIKEIENNYDCFYTLIFDNQEDMRSEVFDFALNNGLKILQINHKHQDLEHLFNQLTK